MIPGMQKLNIIVGKIIAVNGKNTFQIQPLKSNGSLKVINAMPATFKPEVGEIAAFNITVHPSSNVEAPYFFAHTIQSGHFPDITVAGTVTDISEDALYLATTTDTSQSFKVDMPAAGGLSPEIKGQLICINCQIALDGEGAVLTAISPPYAP